MNNTADRYLKNKLFCILTVSFNVDLNHIVFFIFSGHLLTFDSIFFELYVTSKTEKLRPQLAS